MTDDPMTTIEQLQAMKDLATAVRTFYVQLRDEGFADHEALRLTAAWITGITGAASS